MKSKDQQLLEEAYQHILENSLWDKTKAFVNKNVIEYDPKAPGGSEAPGGETYERNKKQAEAAAKKKQEEAEKASRAEVANVLKQTPEDIKAAAPYAKFIEKMVHHLIDQQHKDDRSKNISVSNPNKSMDTLKNFIFEIRRELNLGWLRDIVPNNITELLFNNQGGQLTVDPSKPLVKALVAKYNNSVKGRVIRTADGDQLIGSPDEDQQL
jgi:hypothetical protein